MGINRTSHALKLMQESKAYHTTLQRDPTSIDNAFLRSEQTLTRSYEIAANYMKTTNKPHSEALRTLRTELIHQTAVAAGRRRNETALPPYKPEGQLTLVSQALPMLALQAAYYGFRADAASFLGNKNGPAHILMRSTVLGIQMGYLKTMLETHNTTARRAHELLVPLRMDMGEEDARRAAALGAIERAVEEVIVEFGRALEEAADNQARAASDTPPPQGSGLSGLTDEDFNNPIPNHMQCPITLMLLEDPVTGPSGKSYERAEIEVWLRAHGTCPVTREELAPTQLYPNLALKQTVLRWVSENRKDTATNA